MLLDCRWKPEPVVPNRLLDLSAILCLSRWVAGRGSPWRPNTPAYSCIISRISLISAALQPSKSASSKILFTRTLVARLVLPWVLLSPVLLRLSLRLSCSRLCRRGRLSGLDCRGFHRRESSSQSTTDRIDLASSYDPELNSLPELLLGKRVKRASSDLTFESDSDSEYRQGRFAANFSFRRDAR